MAEQQSYFLFVTRNQPIREKNSNATFLPQTVNSHCKLWQFFVTLLRVRFLPNCNATQLQMILSIVKLFYPCYFCIRNGKMGPSSMNQWLVEEKEQMPPVNCILHSTIPAFPWREKWQCIRSCEVFLMK